MIELTPEQQALEREEVARACGEGEIPNPRAWLGTSPAAAAPPADDSDIFTDADLTGSELAACREFLVPGTSKKLWIFPLSGREQARLARACGTIRMELQRDYDSLSPDEQNARQQVAVIESQAVQVTLCCRQGASREARPCFPRTKTATILDNMRYGVIQRICAISDELSADVETIGPGVRGFLSEIVACLTSACSASSTSDGFPPGWRERATVLRLRAKQLSSLGVLQSEVTE